MSEEAVLYDDGKRIHSGQVSQMIPFDSGTRLAWTDCGRDIPANKGFKPNGEPVTCDGCNAIAKLAKVRESLSAIPGICERLAHVTKGVGEAGCIDIAHEAEASLRALHRDVTAILENQS